MMNEQRSFPGLTGNQLKILALTAMTADHVGKELLPRLEILQIVGRLAFPIFAYMIAEGCRYTHDRRRYLLNMALLAALCQTVYFFAVGSLYMSVLVTFSLSISLIFLMDAAVEERSPIRYITAIAAFVTVIFLCDILRIPGSDYAVDYGLTGVMLPVLVYIGKDKAQKLVNTALCLLVLAWSYGGIQWFALAALLPLFLYNGQRGTAKIKNLFYVYYPAHLVVIYLISLLK